MKLLLLCRVAGDKQSVRPVILGEAKGRDVDSHVMRIGRQDAVQLYMGEKSCSLPLRADRKMVSCGESALVLLLFRIIAARSAQAAYYHEHRYKKESQLQGTPTEDDGQTRNWRCHPEPKPVVP